MTIASAGSPKASRLSPNIMTSRRELARMASNFGPDADGKHHYVVCSGGGPSIMEAANRGASDEGKESIGLNIVLHARATAQHLRHPGPELPIPLFRASQDAFPAACARGGGVPRRVRHVRRNVRIADPDPDRQGATDADHAVRERVLGAGSRLRRPGRGRRDFAWRPRPDPLVRNREGTRGTTSRLITPTSSRPALGRLR